ncbi:hypothetical protein AU186_22825 [Mycobacterium sp. GA-1999]|nr:hypothetical protein AU186_22825 [Mycobacterium sp. GA-1999]KUH91442.1 hypothetical protein AU185_09890 [Mycobacterium sp. GA-0227b]KUH96305.1 hypothetical protein AU187_13955 [Mycobacterium sp. IS-1556]
MVPRQERGGQVKLVIGLRRRPDVDTSTFSEHWATTHRDVVLGQERFARFLRGYVQNHTVPGTARYLDGRPVPEHVQYDGVIEQWFDSVLDAARAYGSCGYLKHVRDDESNFINARRAQVTFMSEVPR